MSELTLSQRIDRAEGAVECERVMGRHCFYHAAGIHREEFYEMWSRRFDITWTHGFGQMGNRHQYYHNYVLNQDADTWDGYANLWDVYPEVIDHVGETRHMMNYRALNEEAIHLLTTPVIEVAEDGQSARCLWYTPGAIFSTLNPQKAREGTWIWERYGADMVKEGGEWLYHNLRICPDIIGPMDCHDWTVPMERPMPTEEEMEKMPPMRPMQLKIPGPLYNSWSVTQVPQAMPAIPEPYATKSDVQPYSDVKTLEN